MINHSVVFSRIKSLVHLNGNMSEGAGRGGEIVSLLELEVDS